MLASLLAVPIYGFMTIIIHADEQLCKLTFLIFIIWKICTTAFQYEQGVYSLTHKS